MLKNRRLGWSCGCGALAQRLGGFRDPRYPSRVFGAELGPSYLPTSLTHTRSTSFERCIQTLVLPSRKTAALLPSNKIPYHLHLNMYQKPLYNHAHGLSHFIPLKHQRPSPAYLLNQMSRCKPPYCPMPSSMLILPLTKQLNVLLKRHCFKSINPFCIPAASIKSS